MDYADTLDNHDLGPDGPDCCATKRCKSTSDDCELLECHGCPKKFCDTCLVVDADGYRFCPECLALTPDAACAASSPRSMEVR